MPGLFQNLERRQVVLGAMLSEHILAGLVLVLPRIHLLLCLKRSGADIVHQGCVEVLNVGQVFLSGLGRLSRASLSCGLLDRLCGLGPATTCGLPWHRLNLSACGLHGQLFECGAAISVIAAVVHCPTVTDVGRHIVDHATVGHAHMLGDHAIQTGLVVAYCATLCHTNMLGQHGIEAGLIITLAHIAAVLLEVVLATQDILHHLAWVLTRLLGSASNHALKVVDVEFWLGLECGHISGAVPT